MQPEDLMAVAIDCRFAKVDRKKLGDLVSDGGASSNLSCTFNRREILQCTAGCGGFSCGEEEWLAIGLPIPFKKTQVQDYMYSFGEKIEPKERVMESQIPSAYVEENKGDRGSGAWANRRRKIHTDRWDAELLAVHQVGGRHQVQSGRRAPNCQQEQFARSSRQSDAVIAYKIPVKGSPVKSSVIIVNTPGFGDTWGLHFDGKIVDQMKNFFNMSQHVNSLTGVRLVIPTSAARLTESRKYVWNATLSLFGKDIAGNILPCFTFADGERPQALDAVIADGIPMKAYFKFNKLALFVDRNDPKTDAVSKMFWNLGKANMSDFSDALASMQPNNFSFNQASHVWTRAA